MPGGASATQIPVRQIAARDGLAVEVIEGNRAATDMDLLAVLDLARISITDRIAAHLLVAGIDFRIPAQDRAIGRVILAIGPAIDEVTDHGPVIELALNGHAVADLNLRGCNTRL